MEIHNKEVLEKHIGKFLVQKLNLDNNTKYTVSQINAIDLLLPNRLDLVAKYLFIKFEEENIKSDIADIVYKEHIRAFSDGRFMEPGNDNKTSYEKYVREFFNIYYSIRSEGFDEDISLVPVGNDGAIIDGGHRVASAIYLDKTIKIVKFRDIAGPVYDYRFFRRRQMKEEYLDMLIQTYCFLKNGIYVCCLWPAAEKKRRNKEVEELLVKNSSILYKKKIYFNYQGLKNFQTQIYGHQKWTGNAENRYAGIYGKLDSCYANGYMTVYIIEGGGLDEILVLKSEIRKLYGMGKDSIHITDTRQEALLAVGLLLNRNSINYLNNGNPYKYPEIVKYIQSDDLMENEIFGLKFMFACYGIECPDLNKDFCIKLNIEKLDFDVCYDNANFMYFCGKKIISPFAAGKLIPAKKKYFESITKEKRKDFHKKILPVFNRIFYYARIFLKNALIKIGIFETVAKVYQKFKK